MLREQYSRVKEAHVKGAVLQKEVEVKGAVIQGEGLHVKGAIW